MNWYLKARMQNAVSALPPGVGRGLYYWFQRLTGSFDRVDPATRLQAGRKILDFAEQMAGGKRIGRVLEVGTGYRLNLPIALRLMGVDNVNTVDLNPYLRSELVRKDIAWMKQHPERIREALGDHFDRSIWSQFTEASDSDRGNPSVLASWGIEYMAPADAADTKLEDGSVDLHTSFTVLEHIPEMVLLGILTEARRVLRPGGLAVHFIDLSDHFSHSDRSISPINFLRFSQQKWDALAGNPFMYMNRLRASRYESLFQEAGLKIQVFNATTNPRASEMIENELGSIDPGFRQFTPEDLAITSLWVVASRDDD